MKILAYYAPARCWKQTENRLWASHKYELADVLATREGGGWFMKGKHEFASREAARAAGVGDEA